LQVVNSATEQAPALGPISVLPNPSRAPLLRPALGPTFSYLVDLTLWMTRGEKAWGRMGDGSGLVEVIASRSGRSGEWVAFRTVRDTLFMIDSECFTDMLSPYGFQWQDGVSIQALEQ